MVNVFWTIEIITLNLNVKRMICVIGHYGKHELSQ